MNEKQAQSVSKLIMAVRKQQRMIRRAGYNPTWDLFSKTFGWHQITIKHKMSREAQENYRFLWNRVLDEFPKG